jgi:hypothetical protein
LVAAGYVRRPKAEKPILLQIDVKNCLKRLHLSAVLPDDLERLDAAQ